MQNNRVKIAVDSETGPLEAVLIHPPGPEVENMIPCNAERALYSDILNLSIVRKEYSDLEEILKKFAKVYRIKDLLIETLNNGVIRDDLISKIGKSAEQDTIELLREQPSEKLARLLIEGVVMKKDTLTRFLSEERYSLPPLHNFFFTRDAAIPMFNAVLIGRMANKIRERESVILESIFSGSDLFETEIYKTGVHENSHLSTIEGGDVLIAKEDVLLVGKGKRTSSQGIDALLDILKKTSKKKLNIIVQELPETPESFIHLDMIFTLLDRDCCMIYEPVLFKTSRYQTIQITLENGKVTRIKEVRNILAALKSLDMEVEPIYCGGKSDPWSQEREQWHSAANFFAVAPGKVIGYERNMHTLDEMNRYGFEIISAKDVISNTVQVENYKKAVITLQGSELPRGGGGARCMTMPLRRAPVR